MTHSGVLVITSLRNSHNLQCRPDGSVSFANRNEALWEQWAVEQRGEHVFFVPHWDLHHGGGSNARHYTLFIMRSGLIEYFECIMSFEYEIV